MKHIHGGNIYRHRGALDFSANLNPLGMPEAVKEAAMAGVEASEHYPDPDCTELRCAIAAAEGVRPEQVICGNGAAELIFLLALALKPRRALLTAPAFAEYEQALSACGCECEFYGLKPQRGFKLEEDYLDALSEDLDIAFLCNPHNPTGVLTDRDFLKRVLERCKKNGILLALDECFLDFREDRAALSMGGEVPGGGLFLLKAFTKTYACAGLRAGYGLSADEGLLERMNALRQPWSVSLPAQRAGIAALSLKGFAEESAGYVRTERAWLEARLKELPLTVYPGSVNYIFFKSARADLGEALLKEGILIRSCENYRGLAPGYFRCAVRGRAENEALIGALHRILEGN